VHPPWEQKLYSVVSLPLGVILTTVPLTLAPPSDVVPYRLPSVPWTSPAYGYEPSVPSKLNRLVNACAGRRIAVAEHSTKTVHAIFPQLSLPNASMIRFIAMFPVEGERDASRAHWQSISACILAAIPHVVVHAALRAAQLKLIWHRANSYRAYDEHSQSFYSGADAAV
jgi:hypothetical protein